ncbi:MAG: SMC-Scp complex subunit ScpB [Deltaproteobacteria bacterium]|nr:SMC-Scp complex subunit ScpB [Deltaproteobacteria bacterium]
MNLKTKIEGLLFVSDIPLSLEKLEETLEEEIDRKELEEALKELTEEYLSQGRAFVPQPVAGGYQFRTRPEIAPYAIRLKKKTPSKLSKAALETLAVIAYRQPILRAEIEKIRGVEASGVLRALMDKDLVRVSGRRDSLPGKPALYSTTDKFLETFGLSSLKSLPTINEIQNFCREAEPRLF